MIILVMGVSGSGKTTIGQLLAESLHWEFQDADSFHSLENIEKMRHGIALNDLDRMPWLLAIQQAIAQWLQANQNVVLACSALKASYRQSLVLDSDRIKLVYLKGSFDLIQKRLQERQNHFMTEKLLNSQFDVLEEPSDAIFVDVSAVPDVIVENLRKALGI
ncbi:MAG: gluconokinase [Desmonostoc vinosum HA7617-LM4]|jgi:gluconokinase|nr:gluconokinase [Desmonostoc vinosum HA7617-LM4]